MDDYLKVKSITKLAELKGFSYPYVIFKIETDLGYRYVYDADLGIAVCYDYVSVMEFDHEITSETFERMPSSLSELKLHIQQYEEIDIEMLNKAFDDIDEDNPLWVINYIESGKTVSITIYNGEPNIIFRPLYRRGKL